MAYTIENNYTGNGTTRIFSFTFPYLEDTDIKVTLNQVATTNFELANATQINFTADAGGETSTQAASGAPKASVAIRVYRDTSIDNLQAEFFSGSAIRSQDLNNDFNQTLYACQETEKSVDGKWNDSTQTLDSTETFVDSNDYIMTAAAIDDRINTNIASHSLTDGKIWAGNGSNVSAQVTPSGDVTMANTGAFTIANTAVETGMLAADAVTGAKIADDQIDSEHYVDGSIDLAHLAANSVNSSKIVDGSIVNDDINSSAAIAHSKLANVTNGQILVGNGSNVPTAVAVSGDVTLANTGAVTIATGAVEHAMLAGDAVDGDNIADDSVDSEHYAADSIDTEHYAANSVDTTALAADAVTGAQIADDAIDSEHYTDGSIDTAHIADANVTLAKIENVTDTQIIVGNGSNRPTAVAMSGDATIANTGAVTIAANAVEIGMIGCEQTTISDSDSHIPTSGAVVDYVAAQIAPMGGFEAIANKDAFPETIPASGVVISISDAVGIVVNGSGTSTTCDTTSTDATVTINNFPSGLNSSTLISGIGLQVTSTGSSHTYNYHRLLPTTADVQQLSDDVNDFFERYRIHAGEPSSDNHAGDLVYDTNADKMKVRNAANNAWGEVTSTGDFKYLFLCPAGGSGSPTIDGSIATYDLRESSNSGSAATVTSAAQLIVSVNGVIQKANTGTSAPAEGFALVDANTIVFGSNLPSSASVFIVQVGSAVSIPTPGDGTVSADKIASGAVVTAKIGADAVDGTKIADDAIDSEHYTNASIDHAHLANDCVDGDNIADDAINSEHYVDASIDHQHLANDCVDGDNLADNAVDSEHYTDGSIDTAHIADNKVTLAKLSDGTQGGVLYYGASGAPTELAAGTNGYYLKTQGGSANPVWAEVSAGVTSDGQYNTKAGTNSGDSFNGTNATDNTLYGFDSGTAITDGDDNTFIGYQAGAATTESSLHTAIGHRTLASHNANAASGLTGNVAVGWGAMESSTSSYNTTAVGKEAMQQTVDGYNNTMIGFMAAHDGFQSGNGNNNIGIGPQCFDSATSAVSNVGIGTQALEDLTTGDYNNIIGHQSGMQMTEGAGNTAMGYYCLSQCTTGDNNIAIGNSAASTGIVTGDENIMIGTNAGNALTSGGSNILIGHDAGKALTDNGNNVCIGYDSGTLLTSVENVFIGSNAGKVATGAAENTSVGRSSGIQLTTGDHNVFLGEKAGTNLSPSGSVTTGSGVLCLGDTQIGDFYCQDTSISSSDVRDKADIEEFKHGLDWINKLKPITYRWDKRIWYMDPNDFETPQDKGPTPDGSKKRPRLHLGFRAQDVLEVEKSFGYAGKKDDMLTVNLNEDNTAYGMKYERLVPILVNAIQELSAKVAALEAK